MYNLELFCIVFTKNTVAVNKSKGTLLSASYGDFVLWDINISVVTLEKMKNKWNRSVFLRPVMWFYAGSFACMLFQRILL